MLSTEEFLITQRLSPPAIVQAAFDEARALEEIKAAVERRDNARLVIGQKLNEARQALSPLSLSDSQPWTEAFKAFVAKTGLARSTVYIYMSYARNPASMTRHLELKRAADRSSVRRRKLLEEVRELLQQAPDLTTAQRIIQEELDEIK